MTFGSLFAGIGGFDLGLERAGMTCKWQVEIDPYCQKVLEKHWPHVKRYSDIRTVGIDLERVDLICGGFPCQPFSVAGKQKGKDDNRYLWPEMLRVIAQARPAWIIGENVTGIIPLALDDVLLDLESQGYATRTFIIPACSVDAPHRRDRVWVIAHADRAGQQQRWGAKPIQTEQSTAQCRSEALANGEQPIGGRGTWFGGRQREYEKATGDGWRRTGQEDGQWIPEPSVGRVANGVPRRVDRLRALGNAVVPQVVEVIGKAIMRSEWT